MFRGVFHADLQHLCLLVYSVVAMNAASASRLGADTAGPDSAAALAAELLNPPAEHLDEKPARSQPTGSVAGRVSHGGDADRAGESRRLPMLEVANLDFSYGHVQVLFDVSLQVHGGETLAVLGSNGAGKSTLLKVVCGLGTPSRGAVRVNGHPITRLAAHRRGRYGIHLLPGGKGVFAGMSVRENLEMATFRPRRHRADRDRRLAYVLDLFPELKGRLSQRAGSLSGGQQQMLALAMVLTHEPNVLLIDELSLGLAPVVVQDLLAVLGQLKSDGLTLIVVEQSLNVAAAIADRAVFLEKGQVRFTGPARDLAAHEDLARAVFLGRDGA
jgi:ABC-type branched-subunit amino acid transport system ATPase component